MKNFIYVDAWDYEKNDFYEILMAVDQILFVCEINDPENDICSGVKLKQSGSVYHCKQKMSFFIERLT